MLSRLTGLAVVVVWSVGWASVGQCQNRELNWAEKMFSELEVKFGTVAKGSDARHVLVLSNLYEEDIAIANVGTTCGCTAAKPDKTLLKTHEKAYIEVKMNTVKFDHQKNSNVDVTLTFHGARGSASRTVRVPVSAYIRTDVVLEPGNVDFGTVEYGTGAERHVKISYAGRDNWQIRDIRVGNENLNAQWREVARGGGRVTYDVAVQLDKDARVGNVQDQITLVTDDANAPQVPLLVFARVEPDIVVVTPNYPLGSVKAESQKTFSIVLRGRRPFTIGNIECDSPNRLEVVQSSDQANTVHVVPFRLNAPSTPGEFTETISFTVDGRAEPLSCTVKGTVMGGT